VDPGRLDAQGPVFHAYGRVARTPAYTAAIAAAVNGINEVSGAGNFSSFHTLATSERNMWAQFQLGSGFGTTSKAVGHSPLT